MDLFIAVQSCVSLCTVKHKLVFVLLVFSDYRMMMIKEKLLQAFLQSMLMFVCSV